MNTDLSRISQEIDTSINEFYLLHGTKAQYVNTIVARGLDHRICRGIFGSGVYFAESSTKADQYAGKLLVVIKADTIISQKAAINTVKFHAQ